MTETAEHTQAAANEGASRRASRTGLGEGTAYWFFGGLAVVRTPDGARPTVIEMTLPPGGHAPLHVHTDVEDSFYLLSGRMAVRCGDDTFIANAGDYVSQPANVAHTFFVLDDEPAVILQTHSGEAFLNFIRQGGTPAADRSAPDEGPLEYEALFALAAATGQPVIGPPMSAEGAAQIAAAGAG